MKERRCIGHSGTRTGRGIALLGHYLQVRAEDMEWMWKREKEATDGEDREDEWQKLTNIRWTERDRCCVESCSPFDMCFLFLPGLERVQTHVVPGSVSKKTCRLMKTSSCLSQHWDDSRSHVENTSCVWNHPLPPCIGKLTWWTT